MSGSRSIRTGLVALTVTTVLLGAAPSASSQADGDFDIWAGAWTLELFGDEITGVFRRGSGEKVRATFGTLRLEGVERDLSLVGTARNRSGEGRFSLHMRPNTFASFSGSIRLGGRGLTARGERTKPNTLPARIAVDLEAGSTVVEPGDVIRFDASAVNLGPAGLPEDLSLLVLRFPDEVGKIVLVRERRLGGGCKRDSGGGKVAVGCTLAWLGPGNPRAELAVAVHVPDDFPRPQLLADVYARGPLSGRPNVVGSRKAVVAQVRGSAVLPFDGVYDVDIQPTGEPRRHIGVMRMDRTGSRVCVTWTWNGGKGSGTVSGNSLTYTGRDSYGTGTAELTTGDGGKTWKGPYEGKTHGSRTPYSGQLFGQRTGDLATPLTC